MAKKSHPSWVRGLKHHATIAYNDSIKSHPSWVRGLKQDGVVISLALCSSHPSWVRGLKLGIYRCVPQLDYCVAPLVGAWIET